MKQKDPKEFLNAEVRVTAIQDIVDNLKKCLDELPELGLAENKQEVGKMATKLKHRIEYILAVKLGYSTIQDYFRLSKANHNSIQEQLDTIRLSMKLLIQAVVNSALRIPYTEDDLVNRTQVGDKHFSSRMPLSWRANNLEKTPDEIVEEYKKKYEKELTAKIRAEFIEYYKENGRIPRQ